MLHLYYIDALIDCDDVISQNNEFTGKCNNKWKFLKPLIRPTQSEVGYAWIGYKLVNIFYSENNAQDEMDSSPLPAVIGPDSKFYIVDDHHTISALDYSGYDDTVTRDFDVTATTAGDKQSYDLQSKSHKANFQRMKLIFNRDVLIAIEMFDQLGQHTVVNLKNVKIRNARPSQIRVCSPCVPRPKELPG
jgi:hypothetical protein